MKYFVWEEGVKFSEEHWPSSAKLHNNTLEDIEGYTLKRVKTLSNFDPYLSDLQMQ
jgi:hypothetical protein